MYVFRYIIDLMSSKSIRTINQVAKFVYFAFHYCYLQFCMAINVYIYICLMPNKLVMLCYLHFSQMSYILCGSFVFRLFPDPCLMHA